MTRQKIPAIVIVVASFTGVVSMAFAAQDRFTLKAPNGVAFSEFRGYEELAVALFGDGAGHTEVGVVHGEGFQEVP